MCDQQRWGKTRRKRGENEVKTSENEATSEMKKRQKEAKKDNKNDEKKATRMMKKRQQE
jgi:hypothetical protein